MFFTEYIWVTASWFYIVSTVLQCWGTPRLWHTFGPASITLDTKSGENKLSRSYDICNKTYEAQSLKWVKQDF